MSLFGACSGRISGDRHTHTRTDTQTHRTTTVTLAAHARRGLITGRIAVMIRDLVNFRQPSKNVGQLKKTKYNRKFLKVLFHSKGIDMVKGTIQRSAPRAQYP